MGYREVLVRGRGPDASSDFTRVWQGCGDEAQGRSGTSISICKAPGSSVRRSSMESGIQGGGVRSSANYA